MVYFHLTFLFGPNPTIFANYYPRSNIDSSKGRASKIEKILLTFG